MVNTKTCPRRTVDYHTLDDIITDAERLVAAGAATTGNWSVGRILEHLARVMDMSIDGTEIKIPRLMRWFLSTFMKKRFLNNKMSPGFKLAPKVAAEIVVDQAEAQAALEHLQKSVARLQQETHREPSPFFGPLSIEEWSQLHCRHSELHMSFISEPQG